MNTWQPIETAPSDGTKILGLDATCGFIQVCYPKRFPRPLAKGGDMRKPQQGDVWEYFRDENNAKGHTWSMIPTHWMPLPEKPQLS